MVPDIEYLYNNQTLVFKNRNKIDTKIERNKNNIFNFALSGNRLVGVSG